ncbi:MAG: hypothetical protein KGS45_09975 [Planctomycetes bacterium]|nr:hypothetical protein [Planctomycetota bacterium]
MNNRLTFVGAFASVGLCSSMALAQVGSGGTISNGFSSFSVVDYVGDGTGDGPTSDFRVGGTGNPDHLNRAWWWYRVDGQSRETAFNNATNWSYTGNVARLTYSTAEFDATMQFRVIGVRSGFGVLVQTVSILNRTDRRISVNLFNFNNLAMGGTAGDDQANLIAMNTIRVDDGMGTGWRAAYEGTEVYDVTDGAIDVLGNLMDANVNTLGNRGLPPAGALNFQGAYQWAFSLGVNEAATASATVTITPTPGATTLALGGLALAARRRRR